MKYEEVFELLEKFWAAETTLDEEKLLKNYFFQDDIDPRLEKYRPYFLAVKNELQVAFPQPTAKVVQLRQPRFSYFKLAVAAVLLGLLATVAGWWWQQQGIGNTSEIAAATKWEEDSFDDPEQAAREIKAALALVSSKMKRGEREALKGLGKLKKVDKKLPKNSKNQ